MKVKPLNIKKVVLQHFARGKMKDLAGINLFDKVNV
jgi:hypothetical protein